MNWKHCLMLGLLISGLSCRLTGGFVTSTLGLECGARGYMLQQANAKRCMSIEDSEEERTEILDKMTQEIFRTDGIPTNPFAAGGFASRKRPSSGDLYDTDELQSVLQVHTQLSNVRKLQTREAYVEEEEISSVTSIHKLILQTINCDVESGQTETTELSSSSTSSWMDDKTRQTISNIRVIASDVDGTLLSTRQTLHPRTRQAVLRAVDSASSIKNNLVSFFPATGKSRKGAMDSLGVEVGSALATAPGVFLQGLYCVDGEGNVLFERKLSHRAIVACEALVRRNANVSVVAYDGDDLYSTEMTHSVVELHERYGEPMPQHIDKLANHKPLMHKILVMDDDVDRLTNVIRPQLEALAKESGTCVTQAIPTMLELMPAACSKAIGVTKVCEALGVNPATELLALGDAENDAEMLKMAAIGVAVGNACPLAKDSADFVMEETNDEGGAGSAIETFGFGHSS